VAPPSSALVRRAAMSSARPGSLGRFRRTLAGFRRRGGFAILSKLGHPRHEGRLHDGGIDIPQSVLGPGARCAHPAACSEDARPESSPTKTVAQDG
jgi:hypothetical protein